MIGHIHKSCLIEDIDAERGHIYEFLYDWDFPSVNSAEGTLGSAMLYDGIGLMDTPMVDRKPKEGY